MQAISALTFTGRAATVFGRWPVANTSQMHRDWMLKRTQR